MNKITLYAIINDKKYGVRVPPGVTMNAVLAHLKEKRNALIKESEELQVAVSIPLDQPLDQFHIEDGVVVIVQIRARGDGIDDIPDDEIPDHI